MARIKQFYPANGLYPHHEHRSKKGRRIWPEKQFSINHKRKKEKIKIEGLEEELGIE